MAELRMLLKPGEEISLWAISVDARAESRELAEKIAADGKGRISYALLADPGHRVIDAYGLRDPQYAGQKLEGIPHPTVMIIDRAGKVVWSRVESDYRKRPQVSEIRAALDALK